jgi:signal transduction histidine kinase
MGGAYLLLAAMVQRGSRAATRQKATLSEQVAQLYGRLGTADEMHLRTRRGAGGAAAAYERSLRQFGDELRAGPAQQLSYALLQLDRALTQARSAPAEGAATPPSLETIDQALRQAYAELGSIAERYAAPALEGLTLAEAVRRAAGAHQQRARAAVEVDLDDWPEQAPGGIKTALYRFVRSSLMQIQRQAGGDRQRVAGRLEEDALQVEIYDAGPRRMAGAARSEDQLAWAEARSYVESMGGVFSLASGEGPGPRVRAEIPLPGPERYRWT